MMNRFPPTLTLAAALLLAPPAAAQDHDDHEEAGHADRVKLTETARAAAGIVVAPAGPARLTSSLELPGEVVLNADRTAHLTPKVGGTVLEVRATVGDRVEVGQVLAVLASPELGAAKIDYFTARQARVQADLELDLARRGEELARVELSRARTVHDNTDRLLKLLVDPAAEAPDPAELSRLPIGESKGKLLTAGAALRQARAAFDREKDLRAKQVSSEADFELARRNLETAIAEYNALLEEVTFTYRSGLLVAEKAYAEAQGVVRRAELAVTNAGVSLQNATRRLYILGLNDAQVAGLDAEKDEDVARYELKAPFAGTVIERHVTLGEVLKPEAECFTVSDLGTVWVLASVYPAQRLQARPGARARILDVSCARWSEGAVTSVSPVIDARTRTATARIVLPNPEREWTPGVFVQVLLDVEQVEVGVAVPEEAVVLNEGRSYVFVEEEGAFEARPIRTGRTDGRTVEILEGLKAGEPVVVRNAFLLKAELGKASAGHDHSH